MKNKIQIEKPCTKKFNAMTSIAGGRFCGSCETKVMDFTKMSLSEIEIFFKDNSSEKICGRYNARHTSETNSFSFFNKVESYLFKTRFRKVAVWSISLAFFLLNSYKCMGKRIYTEPVKENKPTQNDTIVKPK
ncbi:MAG: hypothetical protein H0U95_03710 [Bacteroidetes bacterium]|nr:hypothetical protein [Bacteroidota bacterium]